MNRQKRWQDLFRGLMHKHRAWDKYVNNCENYGLVRFPDGESVLVKYTDPILSNTMVELILSCSFKFDETPEGFSFWIAMEKEWLKIVDAVNTLEALMPNECYDIASSI